MNEARRKSGGEGNLATGNCPLAVPSLPGGHMDGVRTAGSSRTGELRFSVADAVGKLTDAVHKGWSGMAVREHKELKGLKDGASLRDSVTGNGLLFSKPAESAASGKVKIDGARGFDEARGSCAKGAEAARPAKEAFVKATGMPAATPENMLEGR